MTIFNPDHSIFCNENLVPADNFCKQKRRKKFLCSNWRLNPQKKIEQNRHNYRIHQKKASVIFSKSIHLTISTLGELLWLFSDTVTVLLFTSSKNFSVGISAYLRGNCPKGNGKLLVWHFNSVLFSKKKKFNVATGKIPGGKCCETSFLWMPGKGILLFHTSLFHTSFFCGFYM